MPIYEYTCLDCGTRFDALRAMSEADHPIRCEACESEHTTRVLSIFAAHSEGRVIAGGGSSCDSCSATSCASCSLAEH